MSTLEVNTINPQSGTTVTIGGSGDTVTLGSGATQSGFGGENTPAFKVYLTSAQSIPANTYTKIQFNTTSGNNNTGWDTGSGFDTSNYRFTCPSGKDGKYYFSVSLLIEYADALNEYGNIRWYLNGAEYGNFRQGMNSGGLEYSFTSNTIIPLSASDYVEVYISQVTSGNRNIDANSRYTWFEGYKLIGA
jgi:hypothetical protein